MVLQLFYAYSHSLLFFSHFCVRLSYFSCVWIGVVYSVMDGTPDRIGATPPPRFAALAHTPNAPPPRRQEELSPALISLAVQDVDEHASLEEAISKLAEVACCSEHAARRSLSRAKNNFDAALDDVMAQRGTVVLMLCFCGTQEDYFRRVFTDLGAKSELDFVRIPITPYFVKFEEFAPYARTQNWDEFYIDVVEGGAFDKPTFLEGHRLGGVVGVISAADSAVPLADYISEKLFGDPMSHSLGNPFVSHRLRQYKSEMHDRLRDRGLSSIRSLKVRTADDARSFADELFCEGLSVIVKPAAGAGSEFVTLCCTWSQVVDAFAVAAGLETTQHVSTEWMVVQEYIDGPEYVVDTVSLRSIHVVTDVWRSAKIPVVCRSNRLRSSVEKELLSQGVVRPMFTTTSLLYDRLDFVPHISEDPSDEVRRVVDYTFLALDALEHINGCAHCELRIRSNGEPVLIELNSRMQGDVPRSTSLVGYDQYTVVASAAHIVANQLAGIDGPRPLTSVAPTVYAAADRRMDNDERPVTRAVVFLQVTEDGFVAEPGRKYLTQLRTFVNFTRSVMSTAAAPGFINRARKTTDLYTCPAAIVLEGSASAIEDDIATIRLMENGYATASGWMQVVGCAATAMQRMKQARERRRVLDQAIALKSAAPSDEMFGSASDESSRESSTSPSLDAVISDDLTGEGIAAMPLGDLEQALRPLSRGRLEDLSHQIGVVSQRAYAHATNMNREAKAFLARMAPPPLFITAAEWGVIIEASCGGVLGS